MSQSQKRVCEGCKRESLTVKLIDDRVLLCSRCARDQMPDREHGAIMSNGTDQWNPNLSLNGHGTGLGTLRTRPFEFKGISVRQALEIMSNGCCSD